MIADIINDKLTVRLITRNVMSVYSTKKEYIDDFILTLKSSSYVVDGKSIKANDIVCSSNKRYNLYENVSVYAKRNTQYDDFIEYINYLNLEFALWLKFYQLNTDQLSIVESLISLTSDKPIAILDYVDSSEYRDRFYTLLMNIGLTKDKLIVIPSCDPKLAVNSSTCQCYIKSPGSAKIQSRFPESFLNNEFGTSLKYYSGKPVARYKADKFAIRPSDDHKYSLIDLLMIVLYRIKILFITFSNWMRSV